MRRPRRWRYIALGIVTVPALAPIALLGSGACFMLAAQADEGPPPQQHSAAACGEDTQCLKLWYAEYKGGIIQELLFWREFEDDVASHNSIVAGNDLGSGPIKVLAGRRIG